MPNPKPNKARIRLLVNALRSGRYQQGYNRLKTIKEDTEHCCLGVACEVAKLQGLILPERLRPDGTVTFGAVDVLPEVVRDWYGFASVDPILLPGPPQRKPWWKVWVRQPEYENDVTAITLNDEMRLPFRDIADAFERTYL